MISQGRRYSSAQTPPFAAWLAHHAIIKTTTMANITTITGPIILVLLVAAALSSVKGIGKRSRLNIALLIAFCVIDIITPFIAFFALTKYVWPTIKEHTFVSDDGLLVGPILMLLLPACVFLNIAAEQFTLETKQAWRQIGNSLLCLIVLLIASGRAWQFGLFQFATVEMLALVGCYGLALLRLYRLKRFRLLMLLVFIVMLLGWATAIGVMSYQLFSATFFWQWSWQIVVLLPLWLVIVLPVVRARYILVNSFFDARYKLREPNC